MKIGIDIDNVISNFNDVLLKNYKKHDKKVAKKGIVNKDAYIRSMFDWPIEEEQLYYNENIERLANLFKPIKNSSKYINKLRKNGNLIYIISGRNNGDYANPYEMTVKWLKKHNIKYDKLILTNGANHQEKADVCKKYDIKIMVDDSINVCLKCLENDIKPLLFNTEYNRKENRFERVYNWKEIYNYVSNFKNEKINVILDTDANNECDDLFALAYMLKSQNIFNIEAITIAPYFHRDQKDSIIDGQEKSYQEILKTCELLNFSSLNKVFKGSLDYLCNDYEQESAAVKKIIEVAMKNTKTYILAIGAFTNIALAIKKEPKIIDKIEVIWLGGNSLSYSNNLEFNFKQDIIAVKTVFNSKVKLTIIPCFNVASKLKILGGELEKHLKGKNELCNYLLNRFFDDGYHYVQKSRIIWDISVIAYMINKNWFTSKEISCPKIRDDTSYKKTYNKHKIRMINSIDVNKVYEDLFIKLED